MDRQGLMYPFILTMSFVYFANAQTLSCLPITVNDLGSTTNFSSDGLVPTAVTPPGEVVDPIPVRIIAYHIVCDASGTSRFTSTFVSVLVQFQCNVSINMRTGTLAVCDGTTMVIRQYQFSCINLDGQIMWDTVVSGSDSFVQTLNPTATLMTPLDNQRRRCIDDQQSTSPNIDDNTHCDREFMQVCYYQIIIAMMGHFHVIMSIQSQYVETVPRDRCIALLIQVVISVATFTWKMSVWLSALVL